jgi:hypothetical protein
VAASDGAVNQVGGTGLDASDSWTYFFYPARVFVAENERRLKLGWGDAAIHVIEDGNIGVARPGTGNFQKHFARTRRRLFNFFDCGKSLPLCEHNCAHAFLHIDGWQQASEPRDVALARLKNEALRTLSNDHDRCLKLGVK